MAQNTKIATSKLNLKAQNIHIELLLKPMNKPWIETDCLAENWLCKKWPKWQNFAKSNKLECLSMSVIYPHQIYEGNVGAYKSELLGYRKMR